VERILNDLKMGGRRRVLLPSSLAFGESGLAPYIKNDSAVILDVSMFSINSKATNNGIV